MNTTPLSRLDGLRYGMLGLPLAFVALPLYVLLPNHYARDFGVPLAALGLVLLGARLVDALIDPLLGRLSDRLHARSPSAVLAFGAAAAALLALGFGLLFFPQWLVDPARNGVLLATAAVLLVLTYAGYSALSITHQAWGAMLGGDAAQRSRIVGWREGLGLVGVVIASVVPTLAGLPVMVGVFVLMLAAGWALWTQAPRPRTPARHAAADLRLPFRRPAFRRLLAVFVLNGIASAIPATLVLFFVQDRLQAPESLQPAFLGSYFVCAALSIPVWLRLVPKFGWRARGWPAWRSPSWCSQRPAAWARATRCRSSRCARCRAWHSVPISCCRAHCSPACWPMRANPNTPAPTSAGGTSPPSSILRSLQGWHCRCWGWLATPPAPATRRRCKPSRSPTACCPACSSWRPRPRCGNC
jgi:hypothetical protein